MRELRRRSLEVYENKVDSSFGQRQLGMPFSPIPSLTTSNAAKNTIFCTNEVSVPSPALKAESDNVSARQAFDEKPWVAHTSRRSLAGCMRSSERGADMPKYGTSAPPLGVDFTLYPLHFNLSTTFCGTNSLLAVSVVVKKASAVLKSEPGSAIVWA